MAKKIPTPVRAKKLPKRPAKRIDVQALIRNHPRAR